MKNGNDTQSLGPNLSDKEMTQFKLDPQTSYFVKEAATEAEVMNPSAVAGRPALQNKTPLIHKQDK